MTNCRLFQTEFAEDNFKFDENGGDFSKRVENTWEKEKLLVTSKFSFSHSVFKRNVLQDMQKQGLVWEWVTILKMLFCLFFARICNYASNTTSYWLNHTVSPVNQQSLALTTLKKKPLENIVGIGENTKPCIFSFSHNVFYAIKDKSTYLS